MGQVHVIGAGLAGLAAALSLTAAGRAVTVYEASPTAGGRCRSYFDSELGLRVDNGNHLLLSGNTAVKAYIKEIGSEDALHIPRRPSFAFMDINTGERWSVRPNMGRIPWWVCLPDRRVPETRLFDYIAMARIARFRDDTTVADSMRRGRLFWRLLEPMAVAALNTSTQEGLARLLGAVIRETLLRGGKACLPMLPRQGWSEALIDPAVATLQARGATVRFNSRIAGTTIEGGSITALRGAEGSIPVARDDAVVAAVPPWVAATLVPGLTVPQAFEAILNIHFLQAAAPAGPIGEAGFIGLTSGTAEWVFVKQGHVSVTISAANRIVDDPARMIASLAWPNVVAALGLPAGEPMPAFRVVKEKRATIAATAQQEARRPKANTDLAANLALAGDWTDTGLPATIEGAIRSGRSAAHVVLSL